MHMRLLQPRDLRREWVWQPIHPEQMRSHLGNWKIWHSVGKKTAWCSNNLFSEVNSTPNLKKYYSETILKSQKVYSQGGVLCQINEKLWHNLVNFLNCNQNNVKLKIITMYLSKWRASYKMSWWSHTAWHIWFSKIRVSCCRIVCIVKHQLTRTTL